MDGVSKFVEAITQSLEDEPGAPTARVPQRSRPVQPSRDRTPRIIGRPEQPEDVEFFLDPDTGEIKREQQPEPESHAWQQPFGVPAWYQQQVIAQSAPAVID